jgi:hypothetical protein
MTSVVLRLTIAGAMNGALAAFCLPLPWRVTR